VKYLGWLGPRWVGLGAYLAAALVQYYAIVTVLSGYKAVCQIDRGPYLVSMAAASAESFLIWTIPLLAARSRTVVWINNVFGFVVLSAAILFAISSHNAPECTTVASHGIDSSGWFEFGTTDNLATFICYVVTLVDLLRWGKSKIKPAPKAAS